MSREEDLIRSTTRAIASTVREVPPLRLEPAPDELRSPPRTPRRLRGASGRQRRWWTWGTPLIAAAMVVALAISLVLVRDLPNGSAVPKKPAVSTAGPGGAPRYYVALKDVPAKAKTPAAALAQIDSAQVGVVVGDSVTGKTLATFVPPARTTFQSVSAAADDRTFVVFAVTSSTGSFLPDMKEGIPVAKSVATLTGSWYELRLAPGTAHPASLTRLPIKPWSWPDSSTYADPAPGQIIATALSQSGQELAVADYPDIPAAKNHTPNWHEVKVFSVATGQLLHDWTEDNATARMETVVGGTTATVPAGTSALTWIDNDRAVAFATSYDTAGTVLGTIRRLDVSGPASGNLMVDSTVIWSGTVPWNQSKGCFQVDDWPPLISADGNTISCLTWDMPAKTPGHVDFDTYPLATGRPPTLNYRATIPPENKTGGLNASVLWVSPSADTLIVTWGGPGLEPATGSHFGVISHGKFTPLPLQPNRAALLGPGIVF
jgi:hypothetical protein